jgi:hypothetical protein
MNERGAVEEGTMMANEQDKTPATGQESDISKAQATQQPTDRQGQQPETGEQRQPAEFDQDRSDQSGEALEGETATRQDTDIEGASQLPEKGQAESGFVGSQGQQDSSSELIDEDDEDFAKGGQGAPEGK